MSCPSWQWQRTGYSRSQVQPHCMAPAWPTKRWKLAIRSTYKSLDTIRTKTSQGKIKNSSLVEWMLRRSGKVANPRLMCKEFEGKRQLSFEREERTWDAAVCWQQLWLMAVYSVELSLSRLRLLPWRLQYISKICTQEYSHMLLKCLTLSSLGFQKNSNP